MSLSGTTNTRPMDSMDDHYVGGDCDCVNSVCHDCNNNPCTCVNYTGGGAAQVFGSIVAGVMLWPLLMFSLFLIIISLFMLAFGSTMKGLGLLTIGAGMGGGLLWFIQKV